MKKIHLSIIALTCSCSLLMGCISVSHGKTFDKNIRYQRRKSASCVGMRIEVYFHFITKVLVY